MSNDVHCAESTATTSMWILQATLFTFLPVLTQAVHNVQLNGVNQWWPAASSYTQQVAASSTLFAPLMLRSRTEYES
jgi:hypothetical protein